MFDPGEKRVLRFAVSRRAARPAPTSIPTATEALYIATNENTSYVETTNTSVGTTHDHYLLLSPDFVTAFAMQIAALVAKPLTGKDTEQLRMEKMYAKFIDVAILRNAQENNVLSTRKTTSALVTARG